MHHAFPTPREQPETLSTLGKHVLAVSESSSADMTSEVADGTPMALGLNIQQVFLEHKRHN